MEGILTDYTRTISLPVICKTRLYLFVVVIVVVRCSFGAFVEKKLRGGNGGEDIVSLEMNFLISK